MEHETLRVVAYDHADLGDACLRDLARSLDELTAIVDRADAAAVLRSRLGPYLDLPIGSAPGRAPAASLRSLTVAALARQRRGKPATDTRGGIAP